MRTKQSLHEAIHETLRPSQRIVECIGYGTVINHKVKTCEVSMSSGLCFRCEDERAEAMEKVEEERMELSY